VGTLLPILIPILMSLITKLAPILEDEIIVLSIELLNLIPREAKNHRQFITDCIQITRAEYDNPDIPQEDKKRYAIDACIIHSRRMGIELNLEVMKILGLSLKDATPEI
jgi:hypothetical protein